MNAHDSERMAGQMLAAGYSMVTDHTDADVIVINTCAVRENADNRLYGNLGHLAQLKIGRPGLKIAVGGCLAQKDQDVILQRAPWVDVVFGTHNVGALPALVERSRLTGQPQSEFADELSVFPSDLPTRRVSPFSAWVSISVGCNNSCTYCIVPSVRGRQRDRESGDIVREVRELVDSGVVEITLLGQNVNSYGVEIGDRSGFAGLLRSCGGIEGLRRVRFASPHPRDFTADVIEAMADTDVVMPQLHLPAQSGSDRVLARMRRSYRRTRYLELVERIRGRMPDVAITTDLIVGFPGESEADFERTVDLVREAEFAGAYTFQYSARPGTEAAAMEDQVSGEVVTDRYQRLVEVVDEVAWASGRKQVGHEVEVLALGAAGKKDASTNRLTGRARDNRLVHFRAAAETRPGDLVRTIVTYAAPHHLIADDEPTGVTRTPGGDAWERVEGGQGVDLLVGGGNRADVVDLGVPGLRAGAGNPDDMRP